MIKWLWRKVLGFTLMPESHMRCETCKHFEDLYDPEDDEPNNHSGYCEHPFHRTPESEHYEYGGHWTFQKSGCRMWDER